MLRKHANHANFRKSGGNYKRILYITSNAAPEGFTCSKKARGHDAVSQSVFDLKVPIDAR